MTTEELMDVSVVQIAVDAAARRTIQRAMNAIASSGDTGTPAGLQRMLAEAITLVRAHGDAWSHAAATDAAPMPADQAEAAFAEAAHTARSRFEHEVVRNFDGQLTRAPGPELPETDAPGRVVITFVVAALRPIRDAGSPSRAAIEAVLDDLVALDPDELVALEVVWSPADERDRMSLDDMRERYPELFELDP